jgi:hypothetical protein
MSTSKKESGSGCAWIFFIIIGLVIYAGYNKHQQHKREAEEAERSSAQNRAILGGVLRAVVGGSSSSAAPVGRELRVPDDGVRSTLDMPSGVSPNPSGVIIGPNGERYYTYDRE